MPIKVKSDFPCQKPCTVRILTALDSFLAFQMFPNVGISFHTCVSGFGSESSENDVDSLRDTRVCSALNETRSHGRERQSRREPRPAHIIYISSSVVVIIP